MNRVFQGGLENRTDIKRMGLESLEVNAFKRLVLDGLDSDGIVLEGRAGEGGKPHSQINQNSQIDQRGSRKHGGIGFTWKLWLGIPFKKRRSVDPGTPF